MLEGKCRWLCCWGCRWRGGVLIYQLSPKCWSNHSKHLGLLLQGEENIKINIWHYAYNVQQQSSSVQNCSLDVIKFSIVLKIFHSDCFQKLYGQINILSLDWSFRQRVVCTSAVPVSRQGCQDPPHIHRHIQIHIHIQSKTVYFTVSLLIQFFVFLKISQSIAKTTYCTFKCKDERNKNDCYLQPKYRIMVFYWSYLFA